MWQYHFHLVEIRGQVTDEFRVLGKGYAGYQYQTYEWSRFRHRINLADKVALSP